MSWFDVIFLVLLVGGLALGFFQGTIKLIVAIIAFYVGIILASLYFQSLGGYFQRQFRTSGDVGQVTAFAIVLVATFLLLTIAGLYTFRYARVPVGLDFVDRIAGGIFGLLLGALFAGALALMLRRLLVMQSIGEFAQTPIGGAIQSGARTSFMLPYFADYLLPLMYSTVRPILPEESRFIFGIR